MVKPKMREQRSRNTTPLSSGSPEHPHNIPMTSQIANPNLNYGDLLERYCRGSSPPPSSALRKIAETLKQHSEAAKQRYESQSKGMRETAKKRKELESSQRAKDMADFHEEERRERLKRARTRKEKDEDRPPAVGAHSVARQDGLEEDREESGAKSPKSDTRTQAIPEPKSSPSLSDSSEDSLQPPPAPKIPQFQTFGPDPSTFDDPTVYEIKDVTPGMTEEQKKEIFGVADYPHDDLHDLTPGTPPDRDFSNAKPPNQATALAFLNYLEQYVRPLAEEDISFLRERGDRVTPFVIPRRGARSYKEVWAEEDGTSYNNVTQLDRLTANQPIGSMEQMNDEIAETNSISLGPMLSRLLAALRPEFRGQSSEVNGNGESSIIQDGDTGTDTGGEDQTKPPTYFTESAMPNWKAAGPKMDYKEMDEKAKSELRYIGFLSEDAEPDYDGHNDDEIAARLRYLQDELQRVSLLNGARKARTLELVEEHMARHEWSAIAEDLDNQVNQGYLKRHRNIGKGKKNLKRPGGSGSGNQSGAGLGVGKPALGEQLRMLIERREKWMELLGPVVDFGKTSIPDSTIFDEETMERYTAKERESWSEAQEQG